MPPRKIWTDTLLRIATPLFTSLAAGRLREEMPIEQSTGGQRAPFAHLEAFGRALAGIGPWLENSNSSTEEATSRDRFIELTIAGLRHGTDPQSPDFFNFKAEHGHQPLVDAAFLALGLLRCWNAVWLKLDAATQQNIIACLKQTRAIKPPPCNWLLFSATIEAFLCQAGEDWDRMRVDYAIRQHMQWVKGDGVYGDGADFHWDYYNSFVIQPMLYDILQATKDWSEFKTPITRYLTRYAVVQERMISPEGAYPPIGRSLSYRIGAFQALSLAALEHLLPDSLSCSSVRCALTAVLERQFSAPGTFDENGWLRIGFCGAQPSLGEAYITTGSLYLCLCGFLHLGLSASDPFWTAPDEPWTSKRAWSGEDLPCDHAIHD